MAGPDVGCRSRHSAAVASGAQETAIRASDTLWTAGYGCHVVGKMGTPIGPELTASAKYRAPTLELASRSVGPAAQRSHANVERASSR
jgi:hypothetical protein